jgi:hypothetical protein
VVVQVVPCEYRRGVPSRFFFSVRDSLGGRLRRKPKVN